MPPPGFPHAPMLTLLSEFLNSAIYFSNLLSPPPPKKTDPSVSRIHSVPSSMSFSPRVSPRSIPNVPRRGSSSKLLALLFCHLFQHVHPGWTDP